MKHRECYLLSHLSKPFPLKRVNFPYEPQGKFLLYYSKFLIKLTQLSIRFYAKSLAGASQHLLFASKIILNITK